jgi:hypothetical protein
VSAPEFEPDVDAIRYGHEWEKEARDEGKPRVALEFSTVWCPHHLGPFRIGWPAGAGVAMVKLFQAFVADERVTEMAGGDAFRLAAVVHEHSPLCCFVGDEALEAIYRELGKRSPGPRPTGRFGGPS